MRGTDCEMEMHVSVSPSIARSLAIALSLPTSSLVHFLCVSALCVCEGARCGVPSVVCMNVCVHCFEKQQQKTTTKLIK